jgi:hypothetical protein
MSDLEQLWSALLSRDPDTIQSTWDTLEPDEQTAVYAHLERMTTEEGWTEPQRVSARAALDALAERGEDSGSRADG